MNRIRATIILFVAMFAVSAALAGSPPQWAGAAPNGTNTIRFVVLSDNNGGNIPGEWESAIAEVNLLKPDFVMSVGDFIPGYTEDVKALRDRWWPEFDAQVRKLDAPFFYVPGNHDITNPAMRPVWLERYGVGGQSYYSFDRQGCHFVVLDTATPIFDATFMAPQLAWLAADLEKAKDAAHVFVFYHHPQWEKPAVWPALAKLLPASKTTIFNGHTHELAYARPDGIPTYVIAATSAQITDEPNEVFVRELGRERMYALVTVAQGQPTVAMLPVHNLLPGDYVPALFAQTLTKMTEAGELTAMPPRGGQVTFHYANELAAPLQVRIDWEPSSWTAVPPGAEMTVAPGQAGALPFVLRTKGQPTDWPSYVVSYVTTNPAGRPVRFSAKHDVGYYAELDIPAVRNLIVDGEAGDWKSVPAYTLATSNRVFNGRDNWTGPADLSAAIRFVHDAERLYGCVVVTDDQVAIDGADAWQNDGIEFFWDGRSLDKQDGKHGPGTGQLLLPVPAEGAQPAPVWMVGNRPVPQGLKAACARRSGGYVYEFSVPLASLGVPLPLRKNQPLNLEIQLDDRDVVNRLPENSYMDTSGRPNNYQTTSNYARGVLK